MATGELTAQISQLCLRVGGRLAVCIYQMNQVNTRNDSIINTVMVTRRRSLHTVHSAIDITCSLVCVCVLGIRAGCAKLGELIEIPFGADSTYGSKKHYVGSVVTVSKILLSVGFGKFCKKNRGFRFGFGFCLPRFPPVVNVVRLCGPLYNKPAAVRYIFLCITPVDSSKYPTAWDWWRENHHLYSTSHVL